MGQAVDQARRQVELTREALASDLDRLESRVRAELDWKARLRRDGPQIAAVVGAAVVVGVAAVVLRRRFGGERAPEPSRAGRATLDDIARELRELREKVEKSGTKKGSGPLWQKLAVTAVSAAAAAGGRSMARRAFERSAAEQRGTH